MSGVLEPGREGGLLNARLRYFDPPRTRAGVPEHAGALISEMTDTATTVTLVNLSKTDARTVVVQSGGYGEHQIDSVHWNGKSVRIGASSFTAKLQPGAGAKLVLNMRRYQTHPAGRFPWDQN
jgi:hypothetical protein